MGDDMECVTQSDGYYAQCINCNETDFLNECVFWSSDMRTAAEEVCDLSCYNTTACVAENMQCGGNGWEGSTTCCDEMDCVAQSDGYWAQCIDCNEEEFQDQCVFWSSELLAAAEE